MHILFRLFMHIKYHIHGFRYILQLNTFNWFYPLFSLGSASNGDFGDFAQFQSSNAASPTGSVMLVHMQIGIFITFLLQPPPPTPPVTKLGEYIGIKLSVCHTFVRKISSEPLKCMYTTKLDMMVHHHDVMQNDWVPIFEVKVTSPKKTNFLPYLLNFCNQIWYSCASTWARVLCDNFGLLSSRSRPQWWYRSSGNICLDDIFWFTRGGTKIFLFFSNVFKSFAISSSKIAWQMFGVGIWS